MGDRSKRKAAQVPSDQPAPQKRKRPVCSLTGFRSDSTPRFGWRTADSAAPLLSVDVPVRCGQARARARGLLFPTCSSGCSSDVSAGNHQCPQPLTDVTK